MPRLNMAVTHTLEPTEVVDRLKRFLDMVRRQYESQLSDYEENWSEQSGSFRFRAMGFKIDGNVVVEAQEVRIDGSLPLAALMFKGKIEDTIRQQLERVLT